MSVARIGIVGGGLMGRELAAAIGRWAALEDHPVTTDDYLRTSKVLGDHYPLGPQFEQADEPDCPIEEEPSDEVLP